MKTLAIVQARLGSTRFPGKVRQLINDKSMVQVVLEKVQVIAGPGNVIAAWPGADEDENDVISRFLRVLKAQETEGAHYSSIARFTADCPLLDTAYSKHVIDLFHYRQEEREFGTAPELLATSPYLDGLDTEIFTRHALMEANDNARGTDREHVTSWMRRHIPTQIVTMPLLGGPIRWSVDDESGLDFARRVYAACTHCALAVPHHTNALTDIGGHNRSLIIDLHISTGGGLVECLAADILRERLGEQWRYASKNEEPS